MKDTIFEVISNKKIAKNTYECRLLGDTGAITRPGQFVNVKLDGFYLRRPISVCEVDGDTLTLIYKVVGDGTAKMAEAKPGTKWLILTGLGNGYNTEVSGEHPLLIGGGAGVPPMYQLAKELIKEGKKPHAILGFGSSDEVFYKEEFEKLGVPVTVTTADGTEGVRGFVTDAVYAKSTTGGQFSFEERMGCGFGACMGCSCKTLTGNKRICREGPVLLKEEILWQ